MAVKLPRSDDLGALPSVRSGRPIASIDTSAAGRAANAQAQGVIDLGKGFSKAGEGLARIAAHQELADEYDAERRFQEFKFNEEKALEESTRQAQPGQVDRFADEWATGYGERAKEFKKTIPDHLKGKFDVKLFGVEREGFRSAARFARGEQKRFSVAELEEDAKRFATGGDLRKAQEAYDAVLQANPYLTPIEKDEIGRKHKEAIRTKHIDWALLNGQDPEEILRNHGYVAGGKMPKEERAPAGPLKIEQDGEHAVIHAGKGAKFRVAAPYADRFAGFIADLEAEGIEVKGDQSGGYAQRNIRGTNTPSKHSHGEAIDINWHENAEGKPGELSKRLGDEKVRALAAKHGLKWGGDFKSRSRDDMHFEVDRDAVVRRDLPAPKGTRVAALSGTPSDETGGGEPEPDDGTGAVSFGPQKVAEGTTLPRYGDMPLTHSDVHKLRTALSHKYQERLRSDIARIEEGQEEERDENGRTWFDKAKPILTQNVYNQWKTKRDAAILNRDATTPLINMSEEEAVAHMQGVGRDANGEDRKDIEYAVIRDARKAADSTWGKIVEWRRKDPAAALAEHPVVVRARNDLNGPGGVGIATQEIGQEDPSLPGIVVEGKTPREIQMARRQLIDATLEAQERVGIPRAFQRTITKDQAQRLINLPDPDTLSDKEVRAGLAAAAQNIASIYGPEMGERVFKDALALGYKHGGRDQMKDFARWGSRAIEESAASEERFNLLAKQAFGRSITSQDMGRLRMLERLDAMPSVLPDPSTGMNPGLPYIGQPYQSPISATRAQPSERHSSLLLQKIAENPGKAQKLREDFDAKFGDGAAARVINKIMNGEASE